MCLCLVLVLLYPAHKQFCFQPGANLQQLHIGLDASLPMIDTALELSVPTDCHRLVCIVKHHIWLDHVSWHLNYRVPYYRLYNVQ